MRKKQKELYRRVAEIEQMSNETLVRSLEMISSWEYCARKEMKTELANSLFDDMRLFEIEMLKRLNTEHPRLRL